MLIVKLEIQYLPFFRILPFFSPFTLFFAFYPFFRFSAFYPFFRLLPFFPPFTLFSAFPPFALFSAFYPLFRFSAFYPLFRNSVFLFPQFRFRVLPLPHAIPHIFYLIRDNATESRHSMYLCSVLSVKNPSLLLIVVDLMFDYLSVI